MNSKNVTPIPKSKAHLYSPSTSNFGNIDQNLIRKSLSSGLSPSQPSLNSRFALRTTSIPSKNIIPSTGSRKPFPITQNSSNPYHIKQSDLDIASSSKSPLTDEIAAKSKATPADLTRAGQMDYFMENIHSPVELKNIANNSFKSQFDKHGVTSPLDNVKKTSFNPDPVKTSAMKIENESSRTSNVMKASATGEEALAVGGDTGMATAMGIKSYYANKSYAQSDKGTVGGKIAANNDSRLGENISTGILGGASAGAAVGSAFGPLGSLAGGLLGSVAGGTIGAFSTKTQHLNSTSGGSIDPSSAPY